MKIVSVKVLRLPRFSLSVSFMYCICLSKAVGNYEHENNLLHYYNCGVIGEEDRKLCIAFYNFSSPLTI